LLTYCHENRCCTGTEQCCHSRNLYVDLFCWQSAWIAK
jgi:hypothetical protein